MPDASKMVAEGARGPRGVAAPVEKASISALATRELLVGFRRLGLDEARLCAALGRSLAELTEADARVPSAAFWSLWREADRLARDPSLGLRLAESMPLAAAGGIVGQLAAVSETGLDAVRHLARYHKLVADRLDIRLHEDESEVAVEFDLADLEEDLAYLLYEASLANTWRVLDAAMVEGLVPARVSFRHPPPPEADRYARFFGCPVDFRAPRYCLRFPLASIRRPMISVQPRAEARLRDLAESELRTLAPELTVSVGEQIRAAIEEQRRPTQAETARRLGMGSRTLQRRLREEGCSFRTIVERERKKLALSLLRRPRCRVVDVAQALGFDDSTSFAKAFRRWTGESPTAYRERAREPKP